VKKPFAFYACLLVLFVGACSNKPAADAAAAAQPPATAAGAQPQQSPPLPTGAAAGAAVETVSGPVLETMNAATYTYVRVKADNGEVWAASSTFPVKVGDRVVVPLDMPMENFHSNTLKRDFAVIYFTSRIWKEGEAAPKPAPAPPAGAPMAGGMPAMMSGHGAAATGPVGAPTAPLPLPAGALPVAEVWARRAALAGKPVTVHGVVMKVNGGILGRNWIHIQDGSGKKDDGSNDLLVTSAATAKPGDRITVTGKVAIDKDFGAGYAYKVLVEEASLTVAK
jgi:hypothetical protein